MESSGEEQGLGNGEGEDILERELIYYRKPQAKCKPLSSLSLVVVANASQINSPLLFSGKSPECWQAGGFPLGLSAVHMEKRP
jgi:hypothetical protein